MENSRSMFFIISRMYGGSKVEALEEKLRMKMQQTLVLLPIKTKLHLHCGAVNYLMSKQTKQYCLHL